MRWFGYVVCSLLLAGNSYAIQEISSNAGQNVTFNVFAIGENVISCHLTTPDEETLDFFHDQPSNQNNRYELQPLNDFITSCSVKLTNLVESDSGVWEIAYKNDTGDGKSVKFSLTVIPLDETELNDNKKWLNPIDFPTRTGQNIDISLSKTTFTEECYVRKPGGSDVMTADANIEGVTIHSSSDFVSCRITIGPMNDSLLGDWALCGKRTDNEEPDRCQLVRITWNNQNQPNTQWSSLNQAKFEHVVHLNGTLTPVVIGSGNRITCHIITPQGEDLVIDADSDYPNLKLVSTDSSRCNVAIGPLTESMLSDWTLYGKFRNSVSGLNEVRLPMNLFLYDTENPYNQAYNVTTRNPIIRVINLMSTLNVEVTSTGQVDSCQFRTPSGETIDMDSQSYEGASFVNVGESIACRLAIGPLTEQLLGDWTIIGKFRNNNLFTEIRQTLHVIKEDPTNPIIDEDRTVENLNAQHLNTDIGKTHRLIIPSDIFISGESCHIRTPDGLQYTIMEGFSIPGVEVIEENGIECGVIVNVLSEDAVGTWTLIARATRHSQPIERRLPFTINVEEIVEATPKEVTIVEGNALYVRLASPIDQYDTCKLVGPDGATSSHILNPRQLQTCGYIINNITTADSGTWEIVYGSRKIHRAPIEVVAVSSSADTNFTTTIDLIRDQSVNRTVGPENAAYCRLVDSTGVPVFDGFGRCTLALDKVTLNHGGTWRMLVGTAGKVIAVEHQLTVNIKESESKPLVTTHVAQEKPIVTVSCSVATEAAVHACKFRDPNGKILLAASGVSEERYVFHGNQTSYQSEVKTHECGLQITSPQTSDLGLWRCDIETEEDTYYGFLDVLCPWALQDPNIAAQVQQEPILRSQKMWVEEVEDEPVTMSCAVEAAIRYCYFRARNGTTFAVSPGMSYSNMEYVGAGFDAGECGVRFSGMSHGDSGPWSCHVGLVRDPEELKTEFQLEISMAMRVNHFFNYYDSSVNTPVIVEGLVYDSRALDYCRFVRIDGFGFTTENMPSEYINTGNNAYGLCQFTIPNPTILDKHPWTVVAKIHGQDKEISRDTMDAILISGPSTPAPEGNENGVHGGQRGLSIFLYIFMCILLVSIILGLWLGPRSSRDWTYSRASAIRASMRNSFRKQPLPPQAPINQYV